MLSRIRDLILRPRSGVVALGAVAALSFPAAASAAPATVTFNNSATASSQTNGRNVFILKYQAEETTATTLNAPTVNTPGLKSLVPSSKVTTVVDVILDDVLSTAATNSGMRLVQSYINGSMPYPAFASQWQSLLTSSAQAWATQNHVDLSKY
jgi:hypothetical protein